MGIPRGEVPAPTPDPTGEPAGCAEGLLVMTSGEYVGTDVAARMKGTRPSAAIAEYLLDHVVAKPEDIQAIGRE